MAKIGYARVSSSDQNLDLQIDALQAAGCEAIYEEKMSGRSVAGRTELEQCRKALRRGDTLVVWRLDRLGRNLRDLLEIVGSLEDEGVAFESLSDRIDTSTAAGKMFFQVFGALAEFERNVIRERTMAGLAAARARGRQGGRRAALGPQQIQEIRALLRDPAFTVSMIAKKYKVSRTTIYRTVGVVAPDAAS